MYVEDMRKRYILARWFYLLGESFISDIEYDELDKEFKATYPDDPYSQRHYPLDECPTDLLTEIGRTDLIINTTMGYMAESIYSINDENELERTFFNLKEKSRLSFKIDGWNCRVSYFNGKLVKVETRGRSGSNLDFTQLSQLFPQSVPYKGRVAVTGELNIPNNKWTTFKLLTGNTDQRASVRTAVAQGLPDYLTFLAFNIFSESETLEGDPYDILKELGFKSPAFKWVSDWGSLQAGIKFMSALSKTYNYLSDGLVLENSSTQVAIRLGAWEEEVMCSFVTGYEESQGMYGMALNVDVYPITLNGKTFPTVSMTNIANITENRLEPNSPIAFNLRSSANVVLDVTKTRKLQQQWAGRYDEYVQYVKNKNTNV